jgi:hypothetical protein
MKINNLTRGFYGICPKPLFGLTRLGYRLTSQLKKDQKIILDVNEQEISMAGNPIKGNVNELALRFTNMGTQHVKIEGNIYPWNLNAALRFALRNEKVRRKK